MYSISVLNTLASRNADCFKMEIISLALIYTPWEELSCTVDSAI